MSIYPELLASKNPSATIIFNSGTDVRNQIFDALKNGLQGFIFILPSNSPQKSTSTQPFLLFTKVLDNPAQNVLQNSTWVVREHETDTTDLDIFNTTVKLKPKKEFKVEITIQSIEKGKINFFPDEFEDLW